TFHLTPRRECARRAPVGRNVTPGTLTRSACRDLVTHDRPTLRHQLRGRPRADRGRRRQKPGRRAAAAPSGGAARTPGRPRPADVGHPAPAPPGRTRPLLTRTAADVAGRAAPGRAARAER